MDKTEIKQRVLSDVDPKLRAAKKREQRRTAIITAAEFIGVIVLVVIMFFILMGTSTVDGDSMYPTLHNGDKVIYQRHTSEFRRGDIVAINMDSGEVYVKRVIGLPGDTVNVQHGKVYVNGNEMVVEEAVGETNPTEGSAVTYPYVVLDDEYFVMGDNREVSDDSRNFGAVRDEQIKGKIKSYIGSVE